MWSRSALAKFFCFTFLGSFLPADLASTSGSERVQDHPITSQGEISDRWVRRISHILSARTSIIPPSQISDSTDFCPFVRPNLPMTLWDLEVSRWEIVMCIFMFLPFGKSTGLLFVFKVRLLPDLSRCPFFPLFSFADTPAHESLSNRLYFFIFIFLSVSPYRSRSSRSCLCRWNLLLPMPAECWSAPIYIQTMDGVESRFTSSFLLSVTLLEPLIPHSHPLFPSPLFIQSPPCSVAVLCF